MGECCACVREGGSLTEHPPAPCGNLVIGLAAAGSWGRFGVDDHGGPPDAVPATDAARAATVIARPPAGHTAARARGAAGARRGRSALGRRDARGDVARWWARRGAH